MHGIVNPAKSPWRGRSSASGRTNSLFLLKGYALTLPSKHWCLYPQLGAFFSLDQRNISFQEIITTEEPQLCKVLRISVCWVSSPKQDTHITKFKKLEYLKIVSNWYFWHFGQVHIYVYRLFIVIVMLDFIPHNSELCVREEIWIIPCSRAKYVRASNRLCIVKLKYSYIKWNRVSEVSCSFY